MTKTFPRFPFLNPFLTSVASLMIALTFVPTLRAAAQETTIPDTLEPPAILSPVPEQFSDQARLWQGIPSVERDRDGGLWCCWYSGGRSEATENVVLLAYSADDGDSWSEPVLAVKPSENVRAFDPTLWLDPDGTLWLFWAQSEFNVEFASRGWDGRAGVWAMPTREPSKGLKAQWDKPRRLCDGVMLNKPIVDANGRWLYPVSIWRSRGRYEVDPATLGADLFVSRDHGESVTFVGKVEVPDGLSACDEHMFVEKKDGTLWCWVRTMQGIGESFSKDGGKTWSELQVMAEVRHTVSRFFVRRLDSGALLLIKHGAIDDACDRENLTAFLSTDDGASWSAGLMLDERYEVSYPDACQSSDGTIYAVWDHNRRDDKEILGGRFSESDVAKGAFETPRAETKIMINKATGKEN